VPPFGPGIGAGPGFGPTPLPPTISLRTPDTPSPPVVSTPEPSGLLLMATALALFRVVRVRAQRQDGGGEALTGGPL